MASLVLWVNLSEFICTNAKCLMKSLNGILESEIECAEEDEEADEEAVLPKDILSEIIDNPGDQVIILIREPAGEKIEAMVYMNFYEESGDQDDKVDTEIRTLMVMICSQPSF